MTQKQVVENKLRKDGEASNFWAFSNHISLRLGAIIFVLKKEGWIFDDEKSGFVPGTKNWRYVLKSAPAPKPIIIRGVGHLPTYEELVKAGKL